MFEIYSLGDAELVYATLNGIAGFFAADGFSGMMKVAALLGLIFAGMRHFVADGMHSPGQSIMSGGNFGPMSLVMPFMVFSMVLPTTSFIVVDAMDQSAMEVDNVPIIVGLPVAITSQVGRAISEGFETAFQPVEGARMTKVGYMDALFIMDSMRKLDLQGMKLNGNVNYDMGKTLSRYYSDCVKVDMEAIYPPPTLNASKLKASTDIISDLSVGAFANISTVVYASLNTSGTPAAPSADELEVTCGQAYDEIKNAFASDTIVNSAGDYIKAGVFKKASSTGTAIDLTNSALSALGMDAVAGSRFLTNVLVGRAIQKAEIVHAAAAGANSAGWAMVLSSAESTRNAKWITEKTLFDKYARPFMAFIEVLSLAVAPLIPFILLTGSTKALLGWLMMSVWISMWSPILTLTNFFVTTKCKADLTAYMNALASSGITDVTYLSSIEGLGYLSGVTNEWLAVGAMLSAATPVISMAVLTGGMTGLTSLASGLGKSDGANTSPVAGTAMDAGPMMRGSPGMELGPQGGARPGAEAMLPKFSMSQAASANVSRTQEASDAAQSNFAKQEGASYTSQLNSQKGQQALAKIGDDLRSGTSQESSDMMQFMNSNSQTKGLSSGAKRAYATAMSVAAKAGVGVNTPLFKATLESAATAQGVSSDDLTAMESVQMSSQDSQTASTKASAMSSKGHSAEDARIASQGVTKGKSKQQIAAYNQSQAAMKGAAEKATDAKAWAQSLGQQEDRNALQFGNQLSQESAKKLMDHVGANPQLAAVAAEEKAAMGRMGIYQSSQKMNQAAAAQALINSATGGNAESSALLMDLAKDSMLSSIGAKSDFSGKDDAKKKADEAGGRLKEGEKTKADVKAKTDKSNNLPEEVDNDLNKAEEELAGGPKVKTAQVGEKKKPKPLGSGKGSSQAKAGKSASLGGDEKGSGEEVKPAEVATSGENQSGDTGKQVKAAQVATAGAGQGNTGKKDKVAPAGNGGKGKGGSDDKHSKPTENEGHASDSEAKANEEKLNRENDAKKPENQNEKEKLGSGNEDDNNKVNKPETGSNNGAVKSSPSAKGFTPQAQTRLGFGDILMMSSQLKMAGDAAQGNSFLSKAKAAYEGMSEKSRDAIASAVGSGNKIGTDGNGGFTDSGEKANFENVDKAAENNGLVRDGTAKENGPKGLVPKDYRKGASKPAAKKDSDNNASKEEGKEEGKAEAKAEEQQQNGDAGKDKSKEAGREEGKAEGSGKAKPGEDQASQGQSQVKSSEAKPQSQGDGKGKPVEAKGGQGKQSEDKAQGQGDGKGKPVEAKGGQGKQSEEKPQGQGDRKGEGQGSGSEVKTPKIGAEGGGKPIEGLNDATGNKDGKGVTLSDGKQYSFMGSGGNSNKPKTVTVGEPGGSSGVTGMKPKLGGAKPDSEWDNDSKGDVGMKPLKGGGGGATGENAGTFGQPKMPKLGQPLQAPKDPSQNGGREVGFGGGLKRTKEDGTPMSMAEMAESNFGATGQRMAGNLNTGRARQAGEFGSMAANTIALGNDAASAAAGQALDYAVAHPGEVALGAAEVGLAVAGMGAAKLAVTGVKVAAKSAIKGAVKQAAKEGVPLAEKIATGAQRAEAAGADTVRKAAMKRATAKGADTTEMGARHMVERHEEAAAIARAAKGVKPTRGGPSPKTPPKPPERPPSPFING
jgi:TraG-like protein, N-terminal region